VRFIPLDDRLLVKPLEETEEKVGSIIVPDTAKEKPLFGIVEGIGNDEDIQNLFKKGDKIAYTKYGGQEIKINDEDYLVVQRSDILGKIEK